MYQKRKLWRIESLGKIYEIRAQDFETYSGTSEVIFFDRVGFMKKMLKIALFPEYTNIFLLEDLDVNQS